MPKRPTTQASDANKQRVQDMLRQGPPRLQALNDRFSAAQLAQPLEPGEWSPHRILAHLVSCEARASEAIIHALLVDEPPFQPIHAERDLGALMRHEQYTFAELLAYLTFRRRMLLTVLEGLNHDQWLRTFQPAGRKKKQTVYNMTRGTAIHESEHLEHLESLLGVGR